jgi:hypothetical protein
MPLSTATFGGLLLMTGNHSRSESLFYYFRLAVRSNVNGCDQAIALVDPAPLLRQCVYLRIAVAGLGNYTFLTLRHEVRETNVYAGPNGWILKRFSNAVQSLDVTIHKRAFGKRHWFRVHCRSLGAIEGQSFTSAWALLTGSRFFL